MKIFTKLVPLVVGLLGAVSVSATTLSALASVQRAHLLGPATPTLPQLPPGTGASLTVYPNPSQGLVTVTLNERGMADYKLRFRNIIGQEVRTFNLRPELTSPGVKLDLSDLPAGLYFYSLLIDNKAVLTKRLTLQ